MTEPHILLPAEMDDLLRQHRRDPGEDPPATIHCATVEESVAAATQHQRDHWFTHHFTRWDDPDLPKQRISTMRTRWVNGGRALENTYVLSCGHTFTVRLAAVAAWPVAGLPRA